MGPGCGRPAPCPRNVCPRALRGSKSRAKCGRPGRAAGEPARALKASTPRQLRQPRLCRGRPSSGKRLSRSLSRRGLAGRLRAPPYAVPFLWSRWEGRSAMNRSGLWALLMVCCLALALSAQGGIQQAKIKKVQPDTSTITLTVNGKDIDYAVLPETRLKGPGGEDLTDRLKDRRFKEGAAVMFKPATKGGKAVLLGLRFVPAGKGPGFKKEPPNFDSSGLKPLTELGAGAYKG